MSTTFTNVANTLSAAAQTPTCSSKVCSSNQKERKIPTVLYFALFGVVAAIVLYTYLQGKAILDATDCLKDTGGSAEDRKKSRKRLERAAILQAKSKIL
jgi:hypothetical protein